MILSILSGFEKKVVETMQMKISINIHICIIRYLQLNPLDIGEKDITNQLDKRRKHINILLFRP